MRTDIEFWQAALSTILIVIVVGVSWWRRLGLERSVVWAALRATGQLLTVGLFFTIIFDSRLSQLWGALWVVVMVATSGGVVGRRTGASRDMIVVGLVAIGATVAVVLAVIFGVGVLPFDSVSVVVIAGITIGNTLPTVVQAVERTRTHLQESIGQIEAMLALGFDAPESTRRVVHDVARLALIPQIERTKVVGLIALPGAMTGLLLAGVDPLDAVLIQLVVMFLVLGAVALSVIIVTMALANRALTADLRLADWVRSLSTASGH